MSSGPTTAIDNLLSADGYLDEAFAFPDDLTTGELDDLVLAKDFLRIVIDSVMERQS